MNLKKIQHYIAEYKKDLDHSREMEDAFKWESLKNFQDHWNLEAGDFGKMYDACFQNNTSRRLWKGDNFFPKEMMLKFIGMAPDFVRNMFHDLFDEKKDIENRISRFQFCCDSLLSEYKEKNPLTIENNHFHSDNHVTSMYLAFQSPEKYTLFEYPFFKRTMENIGSTNVPTPFEFERFFKISRTLNTFLKKEESIAISQKKKLDSRIHFMENNLLTVNDFYAFVGSK